MKIFNWIVGSFCRTLGRFLFYIAIGLLVMFVLNGKVHAKDLEWRVSSNTAIGGKKIGSASNFIEIYNDTYNSIAIDLQLDYISTIGLQTSPYNEGDLVPFLITSCTDANTPIQALFSSYTNVLDLNYVSDEKCSFSWDTDNQTGNIQYTFVKLKLDYLYADDVESETTPLEIWHYKFNTQAFGIPNYVGWQSAVWFMNVDYLDEANYNTMLANYKELQNQKETNDRLDTQINQNQTIINEENETQQKLDEQKQQDKEQHEETMNTITSDEMPDLDFDVVGWLPQGSIDSLINLPLTLLNSMNNQVGASCSPYQLPYISGSTISIPCIGNYLSNLSGWGYLIDTLDIFMGVILIYKLLMSLYKDVQKILSLKENDDELGGIE